MTAEPDRESVLLQLREQAGRLVAEVGGPLRRVSMRSGEAGLEIEWHEVPEPATPPAAVVVGVVAAAVAEPETDGAAVLSPIVGTFYRGSEPGAPPFVEVGDEVVAGQVVGIVEAMKLMNNITAEQGGKVRQVLVGDAEPVEFGQPLIVLVLA
jgi:acetyl-CoA carboxylase biotin carboxyl carrier protein